MNRLTMFCCIILIQKICFAGSGTGVGNGGDPLFVFLESTRIALTQTVELFEDKLANQYFCNNLSHLNDDQVQFCREFIEETYLQYLERNEGEDKTPFVLSEEPLIVTGPGGQPMKVAARTILGPSGNIEFHYDTIKAYNPYQMFSLMAHEFGHKVEFDGQYVGDNEKIGPFATGRELIDAVSVTFAKLAQDFGYIGSFYGITDYFKCQIKFLDLGITTESTGGSPRLYFSKDYKKYQTGISRNPQDLQVKLKLNDGSELWYLIEIDESNGCGESSSESAQTRLAIIQRFPKKKDPDILVKTKTIDENSLCKEEPEWLTLATINLEFSCRHYDTKGDPRNRIDPVRKSQPASIINASQ